ncbi:MAG: amidohydrolase [Acidobacteria bacterium]|nr:amidohydrolase [Acidobacteriota bacterium]
MIRFFFWICICWMLLMPSAACAADALDDFIDRELEGWVRIYRSLHTNPELSYGEEKTAALLARELRSSGYTVTEKVGKFSQPGLQAFGLVALMKNGEGPTVMVRTDMDALPVEEKTNLPYASRVRARNEMGEEVSVMHACGHDVHMTSFLGAAKALSQMKDRWRGTLMLVGQPAEERGAGARAMLDDGLYARFGKPDYAVALHDDASLEAGKVGVCEGYALASVDSVDIAVRGVGGHGAYPHTTKDPVVLASELVVALQTIVSRENSPLDPGVVTVGSIHGGSKHNVIPDEVHLQLTVRSYKEEVRRRMLASIERIARGLALAAGIPPDRAPLVRVGEATPATYNNPELTRRLGAALKNALGPDSVVARDPVMGGEDFGRFSLQGQIPVSLIWLGAVDPQRVEQSRKQGIPLPSLHSSEFAPLAEPTLRTGVKALTSMALELFRKP